MNRKTARCARSESRKILKQEPKITYKAKKFLASLTPGERKVRAEDLRPLTERQCVQIRSALEKSVSFWKQIQETLLDLGQPAIEVMETI